MTRSALAAICAITTVTALHAQATQTPRGTKQQHVLVSALGRNDAPVTDLTAKDLRVREDGVAREVLNVAPADAPQQVALLLDDSQAAQGLVSELRAAALNFVQQLLTANPQSAVGVMTFGERPVVQVEYTSSLPVLKRGIERIFPRTGAGSYLLEAIIETANGQKKKLATRPVIVAFAVEDGPEFSTSTHKHVQDALKGAGASLWTIVMPDHGAQALSNEGRERALVLSDVATSSGGGTRSSLSKQAIDTSFRAIGALLTSQYDVTYGRPDSLVPPTKREISVTRSGVRVWYPQWADR
jgi:VWFA-related protein